MAPLPFNWFVLTCFWPGAAQALSGKVHHLILSLPAAALKPEHAAHMCAIMRHLLEDPATLRAAMEAEIRSTLTARSPTRNATGRFPRLPHLQIPYLPLV